MRRESFYLLICVTLLLLISAGDLFATPSPPPPPGGGSSGFDGCMARAEADYRLREYYIEEFAETCYAFCESPEAGPGCEQWCDGEIDNMEEDSSNQYNADVLRCNNLFPQIMRIPPWIRLLIPLLFPGGGGAEPPPGGNA